MLLANMFSTNHIIILSISIIFIVLGIIYVTKSNISFETITNIMLIVWVFSEVAKIISKMCYVVEGENDVIYVIEAMKYKFEEGTKILRAFYHVASYHFTYVRFNRFSSYILSFQKMKKLKTSYMSLCSQHV